MSIQEIMSLSNAEKIMLVEQIWDSINKDEIELTEAQKQELDRRIEKHERGETTYHTWDEVKARLRQR